MNSTSDVDTNKVGFNALSLQNGISRATQHTAAPNFHANEKNEKENDSFFRSIYKSDTLTRSSSKSNLRREQTNRD